MYEIGIHEVRSPVMLLSFKAVRLKKPSCKYLLLRLVE